jgi:hypothetical protein
LGILHRALQRLKEMTGFSATSGVYLRSLTDHHCFWKIGAGKDEQDGTPRLSDGHGEWRQPTT